MKLQSFFRHAYRFGWGPWCHGPSIEMDEGAPLGDLWQRAGELRQDIWAISSSGIEFYVEVVGQGLLATPSQLGADKGTSYPQSPIVHQWNLGENIVRLEAREKAHNWLVEFFTVAPTIADAIRLIREAQEYRFPEPMLPIEPARYREDTAREIAVGMVLDRDGDWWAYIAGSAVWRYDAQKDEWMRLSEALQRFGVREEPGVTPPPGCGLWYPCDCGGKEVPVLLWDDEKDGRHYICGQDNGRCFSYPIAIWWPR